MKKKTTYKHYKYYYRKDSQFFLSKMDAMLEVNYFENNLFYINKFKIYNHCIINTMYLKYK